MSMEAPGVPFSCSHPLPHQGDSPKNSSLGRFKPQSSDFGFFGFLEARILGPSEAPWECFFLFHPPENQGNGAKKVVWVLTLCGTVLCDLLLEFSDRAPCPRLAARSKFLLWWTTVAVKSRDESTWREGGKDTLFRSAVKRAPIF